MIDIAELTTSDTLKLPAHLAAQFRPADRFIVWLAGDTLHLKRLTSPVVTDIIAQAPADEPMSLDEINEIVHEVRHQHGEN